MQLSERDFKFSFQNVFLLGRGPTLNLYISSELQFKMILISQLMQVLQNMTGYREEEEEEILVTYPPPLLYVWSKA